MDVAEKVLVKKRDPHKACFDMENRFGVYGDHEQEVSRTPFIQSKIKSGELIEVKKDSTSKQDHGEPLALEEFKDLKANDQKDHLKGLKIEPGSNEEERAAQYGGWLEQQGEGAE
jgi:hypothetical protein